MATRISQKAQRREQTKDKRPCAKAKYVRMSPSKVNIVLDQIRGKKVVLALAILDHMNDSAAKEAYKVLSSAVANAENNQGKNRENLVVAECYTGPAGLLKRVSFRGKGGVDTIQKKSTHITIILDEIGG